MQYVVDNRAALEKLMNDRSLKQSIRKIKLQLDCDHDLNRYERILNRHYFACGCKSGAFTVLAAVLLGLITWYMGLIPDFWVWWKILIAFVVITTLGKVAGLTISHLKLKQIYAELQRYCPQS